MFHINLRGLFVGFISKIYLTFTFIFHFRSQTLGEEKSNSFKNIYFHKSQFIRLL